MKYWFARVGSSFKTAIVLMLVYVVVLAAATWIEKGQGTAVAKAWVYNAWPFFLLQLLMAVNFVCVAVRYRLFALRRIGLVLTHVALMVILLGAFVTFLYGKEGVLHVREGQTTNMMIVRNGALTEFETLPFSIELKDFVLTRYPGSSSPSSYESFVVVHAGGERRDAHIYMNNVLDVKGYRFFQASYDADEHGSVLSVNYDVAGRRITYTGYLLLGIGLLLSLLLPGSRFSRLSRELKSMRLPVGCLLLVAGLCYPSVTRAEGEDALSTLAAYPVSQQHAEQFGLLPVQSASGRMMPVNTFSSEVLRKLHKADHIYGMTSDQFLLSLLVMPEVWMHTPFIAVPGEELSARYGLGSGYCSYAQVFDEKQQYKLQRDLEEAYRKMPAQRTRLDKDVLKLDEQINVFHQLINRQRLNLFPLMGDPSHKWYAQGDDLSVFAGQDSLFVSRILDWYLEEVAAAMQQGTWTEADKVLGMISTYQQARGTAVDIRPERMQAEVTYNRMQVFRYCKIGYLVLGGLSLVWAFSLMFSRRRLRWPGWVLGAGVLAVFGFHAYGMGVRWYIGGYAPWSNSYETMVYVAWVTVLAGLFFAWRNRVAFALATLFGGIILFVSGLNWMDPQINPLVPVLKSPWLMFHVAVIVAAYGFFGLSCLLGLTNLTLLSLTKAASDKETLRLRIRELGIINEMSLWVGLALMAAGTFLGAVWANESWGRYWGWDPKETWALITMVVYAVVTHLHMLTTSRLSWWFNWASVVAFSSVLMTFFGVNYLLSGMHSYGENEHVGGLWLPLLVVAGVVVVLSVCSYRGAARLVQSGKSE